jgi:hypothetical protein
MDRNGAIVPATGTVFLDARRGAYDVYIGSSVRLHRGAYLVGTSVLTGSTSVTLVVRHVTITKSETITMNAEHANLVRVGLTGVTATPGSQTISACMSNGGTMEYSAEAYGGNGVKVYAVPFQSPHVSFSYLASWGDVSGVTYDLTGSERGGIPARLSFSQAGSELAKLTVAVRAGVNPATSVGYELIPGDWSASNCSSGAVDVQTTEPFRTTQYVSPGSWTTLVDASSGNAIGLNYLVRHLAARHQYTQIYGAAVAGPGGHFPTITGNVFRYGAQDLAQLPGPRGADQCCVQSQLTLEVGNHLVANVARTEWRDHTRFRKTLTTAGWYTFKVNATRFNPLGTEPANLLSNRLTLSWRFHVTPVPSAGPHRQPPITVTSYRPRGLSADNQAAPGATTTIAFHIRRAGERTSPAPRYAFKSVRVLASFDDGKTWQALKISRHGIYGLTSVHDPLTGYVALRSIVTDVHGDRTVQTIYRAYSIS